MVAIVIEVDQDRLAGYEDSYLAMVWQVAQANPAPWGDRGAGELVERIGREIIRRWLGTTSPELWNHQGRDYFWDQLRQLGGWNAQGQFVPRSPEPEAGPGPAEREGECRGVDQRTPPAPPTPGGDR